MRKKYDKIVIWGAGRELDTLLDEINYKVDYIVDKNPDMWGNSKGYTICSPETVTKESGNVLIIISSWQYENLIRRDIRQLQFKGDVKNRDSLYKDVWGQYGEDVIVERILEYLRLDDFSYLEIGVPLPMYGSNTYRFYDYAKKGCLVEANPDVIDDLENVRYKDKIINVGVGSVDEEGTELEYFRFEKYEAWNTFDRKSALEHVKEKGFILKDTIFVPMKSLNSLLENEIDFLPDFISIDVENYEYHILKDFDVNKYKIKIFCIEKGEDEVKGLMEDNNYILFAETTANWIFILKELETKIWEYYGIKTD